MTLRPNQDDASRRAETERRAAALISEAKASLANPGHAERMAALKSEREETEFRSAELKRIMARQTAASAARRRHTRTGVLSTLIVLLIVTSFGLGRWFNRPVDNAKGPTLAFTTQPASDAVLRPPAPPQSSYHPAFDTDKHKEALIFAARDMVKGHLKEGETAKFSSEQVGSYHGVPVVCGMVNAKNSFGGYDGAQRYIAASKSLTVLEEDTTEMDEMWRDGDCHKPS